MPTLLREDALSQTFLTDDGQEVTVAKPFGSPFAQPEAPAPDLLPPQDAGAPPPDLIAPGMPTEQPAPDLLAPGMPTEPQQPGAVPELAPGEAPGLGVPQLDPPAPPPQPIGAPEPAPLAPTPSVVPDAVPQTATQAAAMGLQGLQTQADATQRGAEAQAAGSDQLVTAYDEAEQRIAEEQRLKEQMAAYRQREEQFLLNEKRTMVERFKNFRVDRARVYHQMDTGDTVLAGIGLALGAIGAAFTAADEANPAMTFLMKTLDQDVQLQLAERDQLGAAIGMKSEEIADFRTVSTSRLGEYNTRMAAHLARLERDVAKIAAKTQSATVKANADAFIGQLQQKGAEMLQAGVTADRTFNEQVRARRAQIANAKAQLADQQRDRDARMLKEGFIPDPKAPGGYSPRPVDPNAPMDDTARYLKARADKEEAQARAEQQKGAAGASNIPGAVGNPLTGEAIKNDDGSVWTPPGEKEQIAARAMVPAVQNVRRISDLVQILRKKEGGSAAIVGSAEYQEMVSLARMLDMEQKDIWGLGVIQGRDLEILEALRGGKDPTSYIYETGQAFKSLADRLEDRATNQARSWGFRGKKLPIVRMAVAESQELTKEQNVERLTAPLPTAAQGDSPEATRVRERALEEKKAAVPELLRKKPSIEELSTWGQKLDAERAAGRLSSEEALSVMNQTAPQVLQEWRSRIQKMSTDELLKAQKDPQFYQRARILALLDSGQARPEEIYSLVIGAR